MLDSPASVHSGPTASHYVLGKVSTEHKPGVSRYRKDSALTLLRASCEPRRRFTSDTGR